MHEEVSLTFALINVHTVVIGTLVAVVCTLGKIIARQNRLLGSLQEDFEHLLEQRLPDCERQLHEIASEVHGIAVEIDQLEHRLVVIGDAHR